MVQWRRPPSFIQRVRSKRAFQAEVHAAFGTAVQLELGFDATLSRLETSTAAKPVCLGSGHAQRPADRLHREPSFDHDSDAISVSFLSQPSLQKRS